MSEEWVPTPEQEAEAVAWLRRYSEDQPRGPDGRFESGDGGGATHEAQGKEVVGNLAAGKEVRVPPSSIPVVVAACKTANEPINLHNLQITGAGNENLFGVCTLCLPRVEMPVISDTKDAQNFTQELAKDGITASWEEVDPRTLIATQSELDGVKVAGITDAMTEHGGVLPPPPPPVLVVDQNGSILDGHHRWAAAANYAIMNPGYKVPIVRVNTSIDKLVPLGHSYDASIPGHEKAKAFGQKAGHGPDETRYNPKADPAGWATPPDGEIPPSMNQPYFWLAGKGWLLMATDTQDGVPRQLSFKYKQEQAARMRLTPLQRLRMEQRRLVGGKPSRSSAVAAYYKPKMAAAYVTGTAPAIAAVLRPMTIDSYIAGVQAASKGKGGSAITPAVAAADPPLDLGAGDDWDPGWAEDNDPSDDDTPSGLGDKLAALGDAAAAIVAFGILTDSSAQADQMTNTTAAQGTDLGATDAMQAAGITSIDVLLDDAACSDCQDAADAGPYDVGDSPTPVHPSCECETQPHTDDDESRSTPLERMRERRDWAEWDAAHEGQWAAKVTPTDDKGKATLTVKTPDGRTYSQTGSRVATATHVVGHVTSPEHIDSYTKNQGVGATVHGSLASAQAQAATSSTAMSAVPGKMDKTPYYSDVQIIPITHPSSENRSRRYSEDQERGPDGRFESGGGGAIKASEIDTTKSEAVTPEAFKAASDAGKVALTEITKGTQSTAGIDGKAFDAVKASAFAEVQKSWGGQTISPIDGKPISPTSGFAVTARPSGTSVVSIDEKSTETQFNAAMDKARETFASTLAKSGTYLGAFHDDDKQAIEIDPTVLAKTETDAKNIAAYTHSVGGAYDFSTGNGVYPPHVADTATRSIRQEDRIVSADVLDEIDRRVGL